MLVKIMRSYRDIVAICDTNLLGSKFEEGEFQLNIKESFYKGEEVDKTKLLQVIEEMAKEDATFNIVGPKSIEVALEAGLITQDGVKKIDNVPFALVLL